ncbi:glycosyltransferase [Phocaeicola coprophilus]|uniref:glycosyltransferase n=1 Tax=Phocaeicola coprophilus TaxID=387090 RepID=UPI0024303DB3|nr:glycosyltransferase [Phocaeicola coprophilus]
MDKKLISIIIATYNAGKTIERCLKSIIHQKSDQIELLIVDGNSKDNTMDIINQYVGYIDFCVTEPDKGIYE